VPLVSIGMPVRNGERFMRAAIESVLAQDFADLELIVSDNASTDATPDIAAEYARADARVRFSRLETNIGAAGNYNRTFALAAGAYFKWAAHDDLIAPAFLARCLARLEADPRAALAYAAMREIDAEGRPSRDYDAPIVWRGETPAARVESLLSAPLDRSHIHRCVPITGLIRRDVLARTRLIGRFNNADKVALVELALLGDFLEVPERLFLRRMHPGVSLAANPSPRELARWFDPRAGRFIVAPRNRLFLEYARAVARAGIPARDKAACAAPLVRLFRRDWRVFAGEMRRALQEAAGGPATLGEGKR
jgi:glycosyltransferase involved in cell wall biosynthesis